MTGATHMNALCPSAVFVAGGAAGRVVSSHNMLVWSGSQRINPRPYHLVFLSTAVF